MKKAIITTAIAVTAVAGCLAAIVMLKQPAVPVEKEVEPGFELKTGRYYYDGNAEKENYIEVFDDETIVMVNPELYSVFEADIKSASPESDNPEDWADGIEENVKNFTTRTKYTKQYIRGVENEFWILLEWNGNSGFGYNYLDEKTIGWGEFGKFILCE